MLVTKVFSGYISDAIGRRKPLVLLGYGMAAAVKPLFPMADTIATVTTARMLDRFGKGIRGAPRDALVGDLAPPTIRGACFGLRQSMDTIGAVLGPLLAVGLLWLFGDNIRTVLWFAVIPGVIAVALLLKVPEPRDGARKPARLPLTREGLSRLGRAFWGLAVLGTAIALARFSEAFLVLRAADRGLPTTYIPLVLVVMSLVYTATAYPAGHLSDRVPRKRLLALGMAALVAADVALALANGYGLLFAGIALWGLHLGLTQGILASLITDAAPAAYRGTAFGVFNLVSGGGLLVASGLAGWLWIATERSLRSGQGPVWPRSPPSCPSSIQRHRELEQNTPALNPVFRSAAPQAPTSVRGGPGAHKIRQPNDFTKEFQFYGAFLHVSRLNPMLSRYTQAVHSHRGQPTYRFGKNRVCDASHVPQRSVLSTCKGTADPRSRQILQIATHRLL